MIENEKDNFQKTDFLSGEFSSNDLSSGKSSVFLNKGHGRITFERKRVNPIKRILFIIWGVFASLFFYTKERLNRDYVIIFLTIAVTVSIIFATYFSLLPDGKAASVVSYKSAEEVVSEYSEKLAVYDFDAIKKYDLIETKKLIELVGNYDFESYCENKIAEQNEIFGKNPKIKTEDITFTILSDADNAILGAFLKREFGVVLTEKQLSKAKTAVVKLKKSGNGNSVTIENTFFVVDTGKARVSEWKVIDSEYIQNYAKLNNISSPDSNNFAAKGDSYFD